MIEWLVMNWKGCGRKGLWANFSVLSRHLPVETEKNPREQSQDSRSSDRNLNTGPPEYEVGVLTTWPLSSVKNYRLLIRVSFNYSSLLWSSLYLLLVFPVLVTEQVACIIHLRAQHLMRHVISIVPSQNSGGVLSCVPVSLNRRLLLGWQTKHKKMGSRCNWLL
jgi:hypothetical protein